MRKTPFVLVAVAMAWFAVPTARADIHLSIHDGRVVLIANNATIADIMAEWAKVGRIKVVNADKLPKDVVTLELRDVNERQALDIVLRATSGFIAALREQDDPTASRFDRIVVMPPSVAPPPPVQASAPPQNPRMPAAAMPMPMPEPEPAPVQAADNTNDRPDDPTPVLLGATMAERPPDSFTSSSTRHMTETVDPRTFRLPPSTTLGAIVPSQSVAAPSVMGSGRPGVVAMPTVPTAP